MCVMPTGTGGANRCPHGSRSVRDQQPLLASSTRRCPQTRNPIRNALRQGVRPCLFHDGTILRQPCAIPAPAAGFAAADRAFPAHPARGTALFRPLWSRHGGCTHPFRLPGRGRHGPRTASRNGGIRPARPALDAGRGMDAPPSPPRRGPCGLLQRRQGRRGPQMSGGMIWGPPPATQPASRLPLLPFLRL